ncbi:MAG TPA: DNA replication and repair protein RecF [Candidatus Saccharimonadales bacterium]|nr:DNA replication and repair protein RecF [Candidatus Saccharimonadales bacterium]
MEVLNLSLHNWRNFSSLKIVFDPKLTVIVGSNGAGKSNILESLLLLSSVRPTKVETDLDLIKFGKADAKVEGKVDSEEGKTLAVNLQVLDETYVKKAYFIDDIHKRLIDFSTYFSVVVFAPSDLDLVSGSPSLRRHHLDAQLCLVDKDYWRNLSAYNKVVVRRNKVLQRIAEGKSNKSELDFWDSRILEHGKFLSKARQDFFDFLNFIEPTFLELSENTKKWLSDLSWSLKQSTISEEKLAKNRDRDIYAGVTLSGPHRDDFQFLYKGKNLEFFGSRGEQRMAVLALKLAELEHIALAKGTRPVLALDDIFSELDWEHREAVLGIAGKQQTIITAAEKESLPSDLLKKSKVIELA